MGIDVVGVILGPWWGFTEGLKVGDIEGVKVIGFIDGLKVGWVA